MKSSEKMNGRVLIIVQYFTGCPNSVEMINRVYEAIKGFEKCVDFREELVETNELAQKINFRGSPTLLIDGLDFERLPEPENPSLTCRFYQNGFPTSNEIRERIKELI